MTLFILSLVVICILSITLSVNSAGQTPLGMKVVNQAGAPVELFWINSFKPTRDLVPQTKKPLRNNSIAKINTYESHQFSIRFMKHVPGTEVNFTAGSVDETVEVNVDETSGQLKVYKHDRRKDLSLVVSQAYQGCLHNTTHAMKQCMVDHLTQEATRITRTKDLIEEYRGHMAGRLRNYTCADPAMETTEPIRTYSYHFLDKTYKVKVLLDTENAKIWGIEHFLTQEECDHLVNSSKDRLQKATVAGDGGESTLSETRKAQQAGYEFDHRIRRDYLWPLYDRVIKHINYHSSMSIGPEGQEGFVVIQYNPGDEYISHCDGTCDGSNVIPGARVATSVLYCKVAEEGGGTSFTKANIFVKPKPLMATFFTYKGVSGKFDTGLTEHSGCPVTKGEKWIATTWLREGVSRDNTWERYDPSGIPLILDEPYRNDNEQQQQEVEQSEGEVYHEDHSEL